MSSVALNKELLLRAVSHGDEEHVKALLQVNSHSRADVDHADKDGWTLLHYACSKRHSAVVEILLSLGHATVDSVDKDHVTPLYIASKNGDRTTVQCLLSHGAGVNKLNRFGESPLYIASARGHIDVVNVLLSHKDTANIANKWGQTALHIASVKGHTGVVNALLSHGTTIDSEGWTPLHIAARYGHRDVVNILLSHGATVNCANNENLQTPLHYCLLNSSHHNVDATVRLLISRGADLYKEDEDRNSPVIIATVLGQEHLLVSHGVSADTIAMCRLPAGWRAEFDDEISGHRPYTAAEYNALPDDWRGKPVGNYRIKYINTVTGRHCFTHPLYDSSVADQDQEGAA